MKKSHHNNKNSRCKCEERVFDEFLEDIENDIKIEKYRELWKKYGKRISILVSVVSCCVVIFVFWQKYENEQCQIYSDRFIEAQNLISQERCDEALAVIKDIENRNLKAYSVLSKLLRSAIFVTRDFEKNAEEIQKIYQAILQDRSAPVYIKELAAVLYVNAYLQQFKTIDDDAAKKLVKILETYINKKSKKGISLLARELTGLIAFLTNNMEEARRVFDSLCREDISPDARYRFSLMIQAIQDSE